jgi:hypothetical protein
MHVGKEQKKRRVVVIVAFSLAAKGEREKTCAMHERSTGGG